MPVLLVWLGRLAQAEDERATIVLGIILSNANLHNGFDTIMQAFKGKIHDQDQLLAFARKRIITPQPMNLNEHLKQLLPLIERLIGEDIELICYLAEDLGTVRADPTQIEQVILNLVSNARSAMPNGGQLIIETQNVTLNAGYAERHWKVQP